jgi:hypothetical protein
MDPWLEHPAVFPNLHQRLITYAGDALQEQMSDRYFVSIGERVYIEGPDESRQSYYPDVFLVGRETAAERRAREAALADEPTTLLVLEAIERREVFLEIQDATTGGAVVTVIEVLSPSNKSPGRGHELYKEKQENVLDSTASLVEIDLLRDGVHTIAAPLDKLGPEPYRVIVAPAWDRRVRAVFASTVDRRLPRVPIPLRKGEPTVTLDLQALLDQAYDRGAYGRKLDYRKPPTPPLDADQEAFVRSRLAGVLRPR